MTPLTKPVSRLTSKLVGRRAVVVTLAPCGGSQTDARIAFRLKGQRAQYVALLSDLYRIAALWHGQKEAAARRQARRDGIPWRIARKRFNTQNSIA